MRGTLVQGEGFLELVASGLRTCSLVKHLPAAENISIRRRSVGVAVKKEIPPPGRG